MSKRCMKYVLWFAQENLEFRVQEIQSIIQLFNIKIQPSPENIQNKDYPFWVVQLDDESDAKRLASRSVCIRSVFELWSESSSNLQSFHVDLQNYVQNNKDSLSKYFEETTDFKIVVETYNKHIAQAEKVNKIESMAYLDFKGRVNLKNPKEKYYYVEFYGLEPTCVPDEPLHVIFGRWIADGQRDLLTKISLKTRKFIGNTSMDPTLSMLMANQGLVKSGDFVMDPFVGSGSLLVSAAIFGGYVIGSDIDFLMIHAKSRPSRISQKKRESDESVHSNLVQYGCGSQYLDVFVSDFSQPPWREGLKFDSIITDPPYGIRESTEKVKTNVERPEISPNSENTPHYPSTCTYDLFNLFFDLINFAAKHLRVGGRLVFFMPFHRNDYTEQLIPQHSCMKLVANSEQILSNYVCRRLLTYEKISDDQKSQDNTNASYEFNFRERYFQPDAEFTRKERRQLKYDKNMENLNKKLNK